MTHPGYGAHTDPTFRSRPRATTEVVRRVAVYLRPYKLLAATTIACAILSLGFGLLYPRLTRFMIDEVIARRQPEALLPIALALLGSFLLREAFNTMRIRVNNRLEQNVIFDMRCQVYARLQRLPIPWFDQRASGDLMTRIIEDVNNVERLLIDGIEQGTVALLSITGALIFMFLYSPALARVALLPLPLLLTGALWYTLTAHRRYRLQREAASAMNALLQDNLQGIRQIKGFGRTSHEDARFSARADQLRAGTLAVMHAWSWYGPGMQFLGALGVGLILWLGGAEVLHGRMEVGQLVAFMLYAGIFFYEPIGRLHGLNQMLQSARAAAARVFDILDAPPEGGHRQDCLRQPVRGEVTYHSVSFAYEPRTATADTRPRPDMSHEPQQPDAHRPHVLRDVSLHATPGEIIALVGPTGAGKSTLVSLLPAFYEASAGTITIDAQDTSRITLESLRANIAIVTQEPFLFNGTLRENILYGRLDASDDDMIAASHAANCHDFIMRMPDGYDSRVGERGVKLSVGEKQRVSIARALLKDAPILILDEATASVDTATERLIQQALEHLMAGRTSFVIAHRLSTIRRANQILVLRHGQIVERGNHDGLLARDGIYARLARVQNTTTIEEGFDRLAEAGRLAS